MKAEKLWLMQNFIGIQQILFRIPVYQKYYDWETEHCNRLLGNVKTIMDTGIKHFLGTFVSMEDDVSGFSFKEYFIIDGQQHLTTLMLFLKALASVAKEKGDPCDKEILRAFILPLIVEYCVSGRWHPSRYLADIGKNSYLYVSFRLMFCR